MISIGVSVFILYLLFSYIRKMLKDCGEDGKHRKMKAIFFNAWGFFCTVFFISSVQVLILAFFSIFSPEAITAKKESDNSYRHYWQLSVDTCTSVFV